MIDIHYVQLRDDVITDSIYADLDLKKNFCIFKHYSFVHFCFSATIDQWANWFARLKGQSTTYFETEKDKILLKY